MTIREHLVLARVDEIPCAHVARLLLNPNERRSLGVSTERIHEGAAQGIVLLEPNDRHIIARSTSPLLHEIVVDLAAA